MEFFTEQAYESEPTDFNEVFWAIGSSVRLGHVRWDNTYDDLLRFPSQGHLDAYLNGQGTGLQIDQMTYLQMNMPISVSVGYNTASQYNYLRASNPLASNGDMGKSYYYFITGVEYESPGSTKLTLQLDVWQTFGYSVKFGRCFVDRSHLGIANVNQMDDFGRTYLTETEGLDIGGEYAIAKRWSKKLASARGRANDVASAHFSIMVLTTVSLEGDKGTKEDPNFNTATGSMFENLPNGTEAYVFEHVDQFNLFLKFHSDKPWVSQGIQQITALPKNMYEAPMTPIIENGYQFYKLDAGSMETTKNAMAVAWRDRVDLGRYSILKKFLTYPYTVLELTTYAGAPLVIKPESWIDNDATIVELPHFAPPSPRLAIYPFRYNALKRVPESPDAPVETDEFGVVNDGAEFLDMSTGIHNFPSFTIVNNSGIAYLASNAHNIAFQHRSNDWSQNKAMQGANTGYDQATMNMNSERSMFNTEMERGHLQTNLQNETLGWQTIQGAVNSTAGAVMGGKGALPGAAMGLLNAGASYAIGLNQNNQGLQISQGAAMSNLGTSQTNSGYMRDTNLALASSVAAGDHAMGILGIKAKNQDAQLVQPTTSGQVGGEAFNLAAHQMGYDLKLKMLQPGAMRSVGEFWLRYGYNVNRFTLFPESFMVMTNFTYWKLKEVYIISQGLTETHKQTLRGIFTKGATVWTDPDKIGVIDIANNYPLEGVFID